MNIKVQKLEACLALVMAAVDPEDLKSTQRLLRNSPNNATLKLWAENSAPPTELESVQEACPW